MEVMELLVRIMGEVGGGGRALENETQSRKCWMERSLHRLLSIFGAGRSGLRDT